MDAEELGKILGRRVRSVSQIVKGVNTTYSVMLDDRDCVLRIYSHRKPMEEIEFELAVLLEMDHEKSDGISTPRPLEGPRGQYLHAIGGRYAVLFSRVNGDPLIPSEKSFRSLGRALNVIHQTRTNAIGKTGRYLPIAGLIERSHRYADMFSDHKALVGWLEVCVAPHDDLTGIVLCHGDFWPGNTLIDGTSVSVFDFEDCHLGRPIYDFATLAWWIWKCERSHFSELINAFIDGYGRGFTAEEIFFLSRYVILREIRITLLLLENDLLNAELVQKYREGLELFLRDWRSGIPFKGLGWQSDSW